MEENGWQSTALWDSSIQNNAARFQTIDLDMLVPVCLKKSLIHKAKCLFAVLEGDEEEFLCLL